MPIEPDFPPRDAAERQTNEAAVARIFGADAARALGRRVMSDTLAMLPGRVVVDYDPLAAPR